MSKQAGAAGGSTGYGRRRPLPAGPAAGRRGPEKFEKAVDKQQSLW